MVLIFLTILSSVAAGFGATGAAELKVLDKPRWIFPGQTFRIALEQPKGSGKLDVQTTPAVEMFDTWPADTIQRFYFRAVRSGDATLTFTGKAGTIRIPLEVTAWADVFKPRKLQNTQFPRIWPLGQADYRHTKKRRTFYSDEDLQVIRESKGGASAGAKQWLAMSDEEIWNIIPGPCVARTCLIVLSGGSREDGRGKGCPLCGMKVYQGRSAFYPWIFDPKNHPWKVGCPSCGSWFPSNDWHKGDMHSGDFPDDGYGCEPIKPILAPNGVAWRWPFIAYYHQWTAYMKSFTPGIDHCAEAFAASGDRRYAHKAAVGLFRLAESMLDMSLNLSHRKMAYRDAILRGPVGAPAQSGRLAGTFMYIQPNWDTPRMEAAARAWDLIFEAVDGDEQLLEFCRGRHHPEIRSSEDFRRFVEAGIIRTPLQAALDNAVARNYPMQEVLVATMALVMDSPQSLDLAEWLLDDGAGIRFALANSYFKDGAACESEGYNSIHIRDMERIFDLLGRIEQHYPRQWKKRGLPSLYDDPKYRLLYDFPLEDSLIGRSYPATGDTGYSVSAKQRDPRQTYPLGRPDYVNVYRRTRDPRFAQVLWGPDGQIPSQLRDPKLRAEVAKIGKQRGWQVKLHSNILDGYGHVILRSGSQQHQRAFWLRYGRVHQHRHLDMLTMGLSALGRDLLPELGYPQGWTNSGHWAANWGTHYGTHITGVPTSSFFPGSVTLFCDTPPARVATVLSTVPGDKQQTRRSRTIVLVDLSPQDCYAVSLERVFGGQQHTMSFHGPQGPASAVGVQPVPQAGGTALGADLQYGDYGPIQKVDGELSCLAFMYDVKRASPKGVWAVDCALEGQDDVHLRMTMVQPEGGELLLAKGKPTQGKKSYELNWAILKREGPAPLASQFLSVLEPFDHDRPIREIRRVDLAAAASGEFGPLAVRVRSEQFVDTIIFQDARPVECKTADGIATDGEFAFWREHKGKVAAAVLAGGRQLRKHSSGISLSEAVYTGRITSCDWAKRTLTIKPAIEGVDTLAGGHVRFSNPAGSDASYLIEAAEAVEGGWKCTLRLDGRIGEGFVDRCEKGCIRLARPLHFHNYWRYYAGKTITNEAADAVYRLADVSGGVKCVLDQATSGTVSAEKLTAQFADSGGGIRRRAVIYDYGPGDEVTVKRASTQLR